MTPSAVLDRAVAEIERRGEPLLLAALALLLLGGVALFRLFNPERLIGNAILAAILFGSLVWAALASRSSRPAPWIGTLRHRCARSGLLPFALFALLWLATSLAIGLMALPDFHFSADEFAYRFQAETYANGRLWVEAPPIPEIFDVIYLAVEGERWFGIFPPGWPAVLALADLAALPARLVNPLLGAALLAGLFVFARARFGATVALLAVVLCGVSAFTLLNAASLFSHVFAALMVLGVVWAGDRVLAGGRAGDAALMAVALGALGATRHYSAVLAVLPFLVALVRVRPPIGWKAIIAAALALAPFVAGVALYNRALTGDPLTVPFALYDPGVEMGFIRGYTPWRAAVHLWRWLTDLAMTVSPLFPILWGLAIAAAIRNRSLKWYDAYLPVFLFGYLLYYSDGGFRHGPRYLFEAFPFAALRVAVFADGLLRDSAPDRRVRLGRALFGLALLMAAANIAVNAAWTGKALAQRRDAVDQAEERGLSEALVLLCDGTGVLGGTAPIHDLLVNGTALDGDVIYGTYRAEQLDRLAALFPDRTVWVYRRAPGAPEGRLQALGAGPDC